MLEIAKTNIVESLHSQCRGMALIEMHSCFRVGKPSALIKTFDVEPSLVLVVLTRLQKGIAVFDL